jgi:cephalosporin-C deacetylase-like acetyl esterase
MTDLERLKAYDDELSKVMPPDFKDWWQNSKDEWPQIAAAVITNLREREEMAWQQLTEYRDEMFAKELDETN